MTKDEKNLRPEDELLLGIAGEDFTVESFLRKRLHQFKDVDSLLQLVIADDPAANSKQKKLLVNKEPSSAKMANPELEAALSSIMCDLQLAADDMAKGLDTQVDQLVQSLPTLMIEIEDFRNQLTTQRQLIDSQLKQLEDLGGQGASEAFDSLSRLELMRHRMESCFQALKEADRWRGIEDQVRSLLAEGKHFEAATRLSEAEKNLQLLKGLSDHQEKEILLQKLQTDIETAVNPLLVNALASNDFESIKVFHQIFSRVNREGAFLSIYQKSRRALLQSYWMELDGESDWINSKLRRFYEDSFLLFSSDASWSSIIFSTNPTLIPSTSSPVAMNSPDFTAAIVDNEKHSKLILLRTIGSVFSQLKPTLNERLNSSKANFMGEKFPDLVQAFILTNCFIFWVEKNFNLFSSSTTSTVISFTSNDLYSSASQDDLTQWAASLLKPFTGFQREFETFERVHLSTCLKAKLTGSLHKLQQQRAPTFVEAAKNLIDIIPKLLSDIELAPDRCIAFTHGRMFAGLCDVICDSLKDTFVSVGESVKSLQTLKLSLPLGGDVNNIGDSLDDVSSATSKMSGSAFTYDWSAFQGAVRILTSVELLMKKITDFDQQLIHKLQQMPILFDNHSQMLAGSSFNNYGEIDDDMKFVSEIGTRASISVVSSELPVSEKMKTMLENSLNVESVLLTSARYPWFYDLVLKCQHLIMHILFQPLQDQLSSVSQSKIWSDLQDRNAPKSSIQGLSLPIFNLTPSPYIHNVGEHLLTLPQHLDFNVSSSGGSQQQQVKNVSSSLGLWIGWIHLSVKSVSLGLPAQSIKSVYADPVDAAKTAVHESDPYAAAHKWLICVCHVTISFYLFKQILKISPKSITKYGYSQLHTDIGYLLNVLSAMGVLDSDTQEVKCIQFTHAVLEVLSTVENGHDLLQQIVNSNSDSAATLSQNHLLEAITDKLKQPGDRDMLMPVLKQLLVLRKLPVAATASRTNV